MMKKVWLFLLAVGGFIVIGGGFLMAVLLGFKIIDPCSKTGTYMFAVWIAGVILLVISNFFLEKRGIDYVYKIQR